MSMDVPTESTSAQVLDAPVACPTYFESLARPRRLRIWVWVAAGMFATAIPLLVFSSGTFRL